MGRTRRTFTAEEKFKVVMAVIQVGKAVSDVAKENNIHPNMILNWKKEFLENPAMIFNRTRPDITEKAQQKKIDELEAKLQKESSEIENIVTTFDEIFKEMSYAKTNPASKEVLNYRKAMLRGFELLKQNGFISANHIIQIHHIVAPEAGDLRKLHGTVIMNTKTGQVLHTPPQNYEEISDYLTNLENT